jgi:hypothetical protein
MKDAHYPPMPGPRPAAGLALAFALAFALVLAGCASTPSRIATSGADETVGLGEDEAIEGRDLRPLANEVLMRAIGLVGTPYRYGGNTPEGGFDCSGLIVYVFREATGLGLPRTTRDLLDMQAPEVAEDELRPGDLVFFNTRRRARVSHAGIYVGEGRFVHAPSTGGTVRLDRMDNDYWSRRYVGARRVLVN